MVSFTNIPSNLRVPLFYAEVDPSRANTLQTGSQRTLLIGQITSAGIAAPNVPILSISPSDAVNQAGPGSMLALMVDKYRKNDSFGELWLLPLSDDGAGAAAVGGIEFTHVATAPGTLVVNVGDVLVTMAVTATMTLPNLATALAAAINANTNLPVTAAVDNVTPNLASVIITAKNKGASENDIPLGLNPGGIAAGQITPTALTVTVTAMVNGATNPSLTAGLAACGDLAFDAVVMPYFDTTSLDSLKSFFNDTTGRWAWNQKLYGHGFTAMKGTVGASTTLGLARNDQHMSILAENGSITPHWLWAPAYSAAAIVALRADPARPMQTLVVNGVAAPGPTAAFTLTDQNTLLHSGISTFNIGQDGTVTLSKLITTYQKNSFNQPDDSYLAIETMFQLIFMLQGLEGFVTSSYPRCKLAANMSRIPPGSFIVTPNQIKADLVGFYDNLVQNGQAQDTATFEAGLLVEQDANNHNRVNVLYDPQIMNQLNIFAALFQFRQ